MLVDLTKVDSKISLTFGGSCAKVKFICIPNDMADCSTSKQNGAQTPRLLNEKYSNYKTGESLIPRDPKILPR